MGAADIESEEVKHSAQAGHVQNENTTASVESRKKNKKKKRKHHKDFAFGDQKIKDEIDFKDDIEIEYVPETVEIYDPAFAEFQEVFSRFSKLGRKDTGIKTEEVAEEVAQAPKKEEIIEKTIEGDEEEPQEKKKSKKQRKLENRLSVAELKSLVKRPDVVEIHDVNAADPRLLVHLKAYRNTVPVPTHWSQRRKFLQAKRGQEKPSFKLPDFIANTGIQDIRQSYVDKEDQKKLKQKQRDKIHPKMNIMNIDYQVLHDAFFKHQRKPKLTRHGDLYFEGKEFEVDMKKQIPGRLSENLRKALGMPVHDPKYPPPWLINMQRYGPPPSYPNLRIPGLNAPIPEGASFGYHPGGWGYVPVDQNKKPLYGDVFRQMIPISQKFQEEVLKEHWGELKKEEEIEEEEEEQEEEQEEEEPAVEKPGIETPSGYTSNVSTYVAGLETPDVVDLRKDKRKEMLESGEKTLYKVLEQKESTIGNAIFGSTYVYDIPSDKAKGGKDKDKVDLLKSQRTEEVEIALDETELDNLDQEDIARKYEDAVKARRDDTHREDFSDLVEEQERKKKRKSQAKQAGDKSKKDEKYKDFKF